jgi:hypothetical protein
LLGRGGPVDRSNDLSLRGCCSGGSLGRDGREREIFCALKIRTALYSSAIFGRVVTDTLVRVVTDTFVRLSRVAAIFGSHRWRGLPVELERLDRREGVLVAAAPIRTEPSAPRQGARAPKHLEKARNSALAEPGLLREPGAGWEDLLSPGVVPVDVGPQHRGRGVDGAVRVVYGIE